MKSLFLVGFLELSLLKRNMPSPHQLGKTIQTYPHSALQTDQMHDLNYYSTFIFTKYLFQRLQTVVAKFSQERVMQ